MTVAVGLPAAPAEAAVERPFTLGYNQAVYGDFIVAGNGNMRCPSAGDPADPVFFEPISACPATQARTRTSADALNDDYWMRWADADADTVTYNSSSTQFTIPAGATVRFARLNWSGNTGVYKTGGGTLYAKPSCGSLSNPPPADNPARPPAGTPEASFVRLTVGSGPTTSVAPASITRDTFGLMANDQPQYYSAYADVSAQFATAPTGVPLSVTAGNVWAPEGFGCYAGWSLDVVWAFAQPNATSPVKKSIYMWDGHVRQSRVDPDTTVNVSGFTVGATGTRVGMTAYEGDFNISGDQFLINGTAIPEPTPAGGNASNFFVSNADNRLTPNVPNNLSVDAKSFTTTAIPVGATSASLTFRTTGDSYLAQNLIMSVPIPSIELDKAVLTPGPHHPGETITYQITVMAPLGASGAVVTDPFTPSCDRTLGTLVAGVSVTYTCSAIEPDSNFINIATVNATSAGAAVQDSGNVQVFVIHPKIDVTKTADKATYHTGDTITFTVVVHNTGDTPLNNVTITDPKLPGCERTLGTLGVGESTTFTCTTIAPMLGDANTITAAGTDVAGKTVTDTDTAPAPTVGVVSGQVISDRDNNGLLDASTGDTGIGGVTVRLVGTDTLGNPVSLTTTSLPDGTYSFPSVPGGTYQILETQPAAFLDGIDTPGTLSTLAANDTFNLTLPSGLSSTGNNFAEIPTSSLAGSVYIDADNDGVFDAGETPQNGVTVTLTGTDLSGNPITLTTTSAADGSYSFLLLPPGTYSVTETQPPTLTDGKETVGSVGGTLTPPNTISAISLPAYTDGTGYLFGDFALASLAGTVVDDAGTGIGGVTIALLDSGGTVIATTTTAADGSYSFPGLAPGTYSLRETQPAGYGDGPETAGTAGGSTATNDLISAINLTSGLSATGYVFAEDRGSLAGVVYNDLNGDGTRDAGEPGIGGTTVTLAGTDALGNPVSVTGTTAADGTYLFTGLLGGTYAVTETQPAGYNDGVDTPGSAGGTLTPPDTISAISLGAGVDATDYLFGEVAPASLSGVVYHDSNNNGVQDAGEPGIAGTTVTLTGTTGAGDPVSITGTTAIDGTYSFINLAPGTYQVVETQPAGFVDGKDAVGSAGGTLVPPDTISAITVLSGTVGTGYTFGEITVGNIAGAVIDDAGNPIANVTITLTGTDDLGNPVIATVLTAPDGTYVFPGLRPGTYTLTETQPVGYGDGPETAGTSGGSTAVNDVISGIVLAPGTSATGYLFQEDRGSLAGTVYEDLNGNGVLDAGEPGIPGTTVTVTGTDAAGNPVTATTTTDAAGAYSFPGLLGGTYTLTETQPAGYTDGAETVGSAGGTLLAPDSITTIALPAGGDGTGYNFGETQPAAISGTVVDNHGGPIANVTIALLDSAGSVLATTTTAPDGSYTFPNLAPGTYSVRETQPAGYGDGPETVGSNGGDASVNDLISTIVVESGDTATGYTFAEQLGSLAGIVYDDHNGNGVQDPGDLGIANTTVTLTGTDALGNPVTRTATSAADGSYTFADLIGGTYTVTETQPAGYADGPDTAGTSGGTVTPPDSITAIALAGGVDATGYLFAEFQQASLQGSVTDDGGHPIAGVTITLTGVDGLGNPVTRTTTTDASGNWSFTDLPPGTYTVHETQPAGYGDGPETVGSAGGDATVNDTFSGIVLTSGQAGIGYLFVEATGSLAGFEYEDRNNNGVKDAGEPGIAGIAVTLVGTDAFGGAVSLSTLTAADGSYLFTQLLGGDYTVHADQPAGFTDGRDTPGTAGGTATEPDSIALTLPGGTHATDYLFGEFHPAAVSGSVVDDFGNPIAGVTVTLTGVDGAGNPVTATTTTAADGSYGFTDLAPGTYTVTETQPAGYGDGPDTVGSLGGSNAVNDVISGIVLASDDAGTGYNFAETTGSLSGLVYQDLNLNGVADAGEPGIGAVTVTLTGTDALGAPVTRTVTTAADGTYTVTDLPGGTYTVTETQPAGYTDGADTAGSAGGTVTAPDSITAITQPTDADSTGYNFGEYVPSSLSGVVFNDANNNGTQQAGEVGIGGVTVTLTGTDGAGTAVTMTTTTAADGSYTFTGLAPGTYTVTETQPAGYLDGKDAVGSAGGTLVPPDTIGAVTITSGTTATGYTFAELAPSSISGTVKDDFGTPIPNTTITLTCIDSDGVSYTATTTTGPDGSYTFLDLRPGTCTLTETQPPGYGDGPDTPGSSGGTNPTNDVIANIVITPGTTSTGNNFAEDTGSLSGLVYEDINADGLHNTGEPGIGGVTVTLTGTDVNGTAVTLTTTTAADGSYTFTHLVGGAYTVTETQPAGYLDGVDAAGSLGGTATEPDTITGVVLPGGADGTDYWFGEFQGASIAGAVVDNSGNPIANVTITLLDSDGGVVATTTTAADGTYLFPNLIPGVYGVRETQPPAYGDGPETVGSSGGDASVNDLITNIALSSGEAATGYNFAEVLGVVSGKTFYDANNDGVQDPGDTGIAGVTVTLTGTDAAGNPVNRTTVSDAAGNYLFTDVPGGTYTLTETQPAGYGPGQAFAGSTGGTPTGANSITNVPVPPGGNSIDNNFTDTLGTLAGTVYNDVNHNGTLEAGEPGIGGVTVTLTGADTTKTAVTAADGTYTFSGLISGDYSITETQPAAYADGAETIGTAGGTTSGTDTVNGISITPALAATGYNFGELTGSITGTVWLDSDGDGVHDASETTGIGGVTVTLLDADGNPLATTTTAADGSYTFPNLIAGTYTVVETQPAGYGSTTADTLPVTLGAGSTGVADFGEQLGSIGDRVWNDTNLDGIQDAGEPGEPDATVNLLDTAGNVLATTTTDADGLYRFGDLTVGDYQVQVVAPSGKTYTTPDQGTNDALDSDIDLVTHKSPVITVATSTTAGATTITQRTDVDGGLVPRIFDAAIALVVDEPLAPVGGTVILTATGSNAGTVGLDGIQVTINVPVGLTPTDVTGTDWDCDTTRPLPRDIVCVYNHPLAPGESAPPILVTTTRTSTAALEAVATVEPLAGTVDSVSANNRATADVDPLSATPSPSPSAGVEGVSTNPGGGGGVLAVTGLALLGLIGTAAGLIVGGVALLMAVRRRRTQVG